MPVYKIEFSDTKNPSYIISIQRFFVDARSAATACGRLAEAFFCDRFELQEYEPLTSPGVARFPRRVKEETP